MKCLQTGRLRALISPHVSAFDFPTSALSLEEGRKLVSSFPFHLLYPRDHSRSTESLRKHLALPQIIQCGKIKVQGIHLRTRVGPRLNNLFGKRKRGRG